MTTVVILFVVGVILIAAEVFLPGGIIGLFGGAAMLGGIYSAYGEFGPQGAFISAAIAVLLVMVALFFEFKILPKTALGKRLFNKETIKESAQYSAAGDDAVGQVGETATALGPTGFVMLNGVKLEAASKSGFIEKNERVKVIGRDNFRIIVAKI